MSDASPSFIGGRRYRLTGSACLMAEVEIGSSFRGMTPLCVEAGTELLCGGETITRDKRRVTGWVLTTEQQAEAERAIKGLSGARAVALVLAELVSEETLQGKPPLLEPVDDTPPPDPPRCPLCAEDDVASEVELVEHGHYSSPVYWDATLGAWTTNPEERALSWNGSESYYQCPSCGWSGGDPIGLEPGAAHA
jgi:hypothetical protein